jgi:ribosomal-protein-serine acetyltransferase
MKMSFAVDETIELQLVHLDNTQLLFELFECNQFHLQSWRHDPDTWKRISDVTSFIENCQAQYADCKLPTCTIHYQHNLVGLISLSHLLSNEHKDSISLDRGKNQTITSVFRSRELSYWLAKKYQGQGIITRSAAFMTDLAFEDLSVEEVCIICNPKNERSCAIADRLCFEHESLQTQAAHRFNATFDLSTYSLRKSQWQQLGTRKKLIEGCV